MMTPPWAADEVSELALRNDVVRCAHNDVTFAFHVPQAHIMRGVPRTSLPQATAFARRANIMQKSTCLGKCFFVAPRAGLEPATP